MLSIIVAIAENNVIGCDNQLIWHISEDLRYFKRITSNHTVIMGRKTFESIGKPLPNRKNIIITRNPNFKADGCTIVPSLDAATELVKGENESFIIGGGSVYQSAMPLADKLYITRIHRNYDGDTYFPEIGDEWQEVERQDFERGEKYEYPFSFVTYTRKP